MVSKERFLVAGRKINWFVGGFSIAASWIWAPALFVSVQMAYQKGLAGIFWFTFPNIIALAIFAFFAPRIRNLRPEGYTLPQYIRYRLKSKKVHKIYLVPFIFYQIMAVSVQLFAGGSLIMLLTGIPVKIVIPILALIALTYTLISGIEASFITDFVQMGMILGIGAVILPMFLKASNGFASVVEGFGGIENIGSMLDPGVAFSFGIVTSIGLISGAVSDQQYWQRSFSIKKNQLRKSFVFGALLFGIVPVAMSILGFVSANPAMGIVLPEGVDVSMVGVQAVAQFLPTWALYLFTLMLLAGLSSTLDSGLVAASSLWVTDVVKTNKKNVLKHGRIAMMLVTLVGMGVAFSALFIKGFGLQHLWWIFNTTAACVLVPTILSLYWKRLSAKGVFLGVTVSSIVGLPLFIYANMVGEAFWVVLASLFVVGISVVFCLAFPRKTLLERVRKLETG